MLVRNDTYAVLSTARFLSVLSAESAIKYNNQFAYHQAELMYEFLNRQINEDTVCAFVDTKIPHAEFPEWPPASERPVFSDEEIEAWPVVFSDGSSIEDDVDLPF